MNIDGFKCIRFHDILILEFSRLHLKVINHE